MLVLGVRKEENIFITLEDGREIKVKFLRNDEKNRIQLGFQADKSIKIMREKLLLKEKYNVKRSEDSA